MLSSKSPSKDQKQESRGNSPNDGESGSSNVFKTAKNLFTKKFSLKVKQKDPMSQVSPVQAKEMTGAGKVNKFKSNIPGKTTSISGQAYYPSGT